MFTIISLLSTKGVRDEMELISVYYIIYGINHGVRDVLELFSVYYFIYGIN